MPEETSRYLIGRCIHIEYNAHALAFFRIRALQLQNNGAGEILIPQVSELIVLSNVHHAPQILNQVPVGVIRGRLIEKSAAIGVGIEHNLHGVNHRGLSAAGMPGKKVNLPVKGQRFAVDIVPVI